MWGISGTTHYQSEILSFITIVIYLFMYLFTYLFIYWSGGFKDEYPVISGHTTVSQSTSGHREKLPVLSEESVSESHLASGAMRRLWNAWEAHASTRNLPYIYSISVHSVSFKRKPIFFKMVRIPGGNISLKKHDSLISPRGFGSGASPVYK